MKVVCGGRLFDGEAVHENRAVQVENGKISAVIADRDIPRDVEIIDLQGGLLAPGFIDIQVNGGGGVLFNDRPDVDGLRTLFAGHRQFGTTAMLPTLISDDFPTMVAAAQAIREARNQSLPGIIGVHFEGPYVNAKRKGVHDPAQIRAFEDQARALYDDPELGVVVVTLAPERCPSGLIRELSRAGVRVCAGHTAGTYEDMQAAMAEGLAGFTHLFNAMTPLQSRAPGVVGAALEDRHTWCGIIVDGHHVHPATLKIAVAAKQTGKMMLVSDAMPCVGATDKSFRLGGQAIHWQNGVLTTADGTLAGSDLDMAQAVRNTVQLLDQPIEEALRMASLYPAAFLGLSHTLGYIRPGYQADFVLLDDAFDVQATWVAGQRENHR
ncbi:MAG: N-acetylglucosamine-6-phosphate deacetylase [Rhodospirillales bacterium]|nr:N-acetylglucosamine-6-phosphate deacetylase [Rhodospirillales bacterium]